MNIAIFLLSPPNCKHCSPFNQSAPVFSNIIMYTITFIILQLLHTHTHTHTHTLSLPLSFSHTPCVNWTARTISVKCASGPISYKQANNQISHHIMCGDGFDFGSVTFQTV